MKTIRRPPIACLREAAAVLQAESEVLESDDELPEQREAGKRCAAVARWLDYLIARKG